MIEVIQCRDFITQECSRYTICDCRRCIGLGSNRDYSRSDMSSISTTQPCWVWRCHWCFEELAMCAVS